MREGVRDWGSEGVREGVRDEGGGAGGEGRLRGVAAEVAVGTTRRECNPSGVATGAAGLQGARRPSQRASSPTAGAVVYPRWTDRDATTSRRAARSAFGSTWPTSAVPASTGSA